MMRRALMPQNSLCPIALQDRHRSTLRDLRDSCRTVSSCRLYNSSGLRFSRERFLLRSRVRQCRHYKGCASTSLYLRQLVGFPMGDYTPGLTVDSGLACFFTFMTVTEGGGRRAVARKFQDVYLPALKANFMLWPAVQILNFRVIPLQFQIVSSYPKARDVRRLIGSQPFVSTVGIAWTAYLSLTNSADEPL